MAAFDEISGERKAGNLGAPQILKFLCLYNGTYGVVVTLQLLYGFLALAPEVCGTVGTPKIFMVSFLCFSII